MYKKDRPIKAIGEIVLRAGNLKEMEEFYQNILGLEMFERYENIVFFKIAPGYEGQTQFLVLFEESAGSDHKSLKFDGPDVEKTTLHHIAFAISLSNYKKEYDRLQGLGLDVETRIHEWVHYRSLYVCDPDGNVVELACYDESVQ